MFLMMHCIRDLHKPMQKSEMVDHEIPKIFQLSARHGITQTAAPLSVENEQHLPDSLLTSTH